MSQKLLQTKKKAIESMIQYYTQVLSTVKERQANNPTDSQIINQIQELDLKINALQNQLSNLK